MQGHSQNFYQYKFISPEPLFAQIKEEMRLYFASGQIDDLMFPVYLNDVLRKLGKGSYKIEETILFIDCYQAKLPPDFFDAREVWATWDMLSSPARVPGSFYQQITTVLNKPFDECNPARNCDPCNPDVTTVVLKTNTYFQHSWKMKHLLTPGNLKTKGFCGHGSLNRDQSGTDKFDIDSGVLTTEFASGDIYLMYYAHDEDCSGNQLIPENFRIEQYILAYLKYKLYEFLWNTDGGETYNQSKDKYLTYKSLAEEAYIMADIETKKQTMYQKAYGIYKDTHRNDVYERMMHGSYYNRFPHRRRGF